MDLISVLLLYCFDSGRVTGVMSNESVHDTYH